MSLPTYLNPNYFSKQPTELLIQSRELLTSVLDMRARQWSLFEPAAPGPVLVKPALKGGESIPSVLSPSTVNRFQDCSARWYFSKILQLPDPRTPALALGSAVHEAVAVNFRDKIETGGDLEYAAVRSVYRESMARQLDGVVFGESESRDDLIECGDALLRVYMEQAAPSIHPAAVELAVEGEIGGVQVHGFVDVLDRDGTVVDLKTAAKKPAGISAAHRLQVATYSMLTPGASGRGRLDTIVKTKTVGHHVTAFDVTPADRRFTERLYSITLDQMRSQIVSPNRGSFLCSRKNCAFADECENSFGGTVE